ncbi:class I SAM-dependent methyltransferase [Xanthomonas sp. NCPPB 1068]|uniref:class I SAM-dependent methyltransferase n=1 Tax=Xanthomonas sp. NCPPB 1068 TaxID=487525 RepID=UPI0035592CC0
MRRIFPKGCILDVGCGFGRLLKVLPPGSVGVDHNIDMVGAARLRGLDVVDTTAFGQRFHASGACFDGLLCAHMVEHLTAQQGHEILSGYLTKLRPGSKVLLITPQARGYRADPTHLSYYNLAALMEFADRLGLQEIEGISYPFPEWAGSWFTYNENIVTARIVD